MKFESCGPFYFPRARTKGWRRNFWTEVDNSWDGLSTAVGCYVFCIEHGEAVKPWYVGKTISAGGFSTEVFTKHKLDHYESVLSGVDRDDQPRRGQPNIILFPLITDHWNLSQNRSSSDAYIDWLETALIGMALSRNPEIANTAKTRFHREVYVHGIIGSQFQGRPSSSAVYARKAFQVGS